ncbi:cyclic AMP-dependent transcription factor ATF-7 isoform X2 [Folsomia candida]|uniref:Cyclic AMP-dependent transcription factor ATF-2 n=2 Tax=Folsomia candida TaxID=158441 RepID=A0A226E507_FOLCA|nr:cyclic AMP-dependent transcription factor ATF-7 isoform X2 [Folsomia candida]OXA52047.1 Cyclic AMP-dependent transcription factor ATF-2 [Folsomia candida]
MEIEKPFKCTTCSSRFTNEDHLSVHKRRHEMSLNLKPGQPQQQSLDSYVDETPTPTRFFRNCEEVGLFQDLQNVNPFDESFSKAASGSSAGTPSTGVVDQFDFSIALPTSALVPEGQNSSSSEYNMSSSSSTSVRRRYSDHDTLNTPQVFGYILSTNTPTATNFSSTTTTVLNPVPSTAMTFRTNEDIASNTHQDAKSFSNQDIEQKVFPNSNTGLIGKDQKPKTSLKLNLSPITPILSSYNGSDDSDNIKRQKLKGLPFSLEPEKKAELLERNKAAAARSRQRRKQWVNNLEERCETLEKLLAHAKSELIREQTENQILRAELSKHGNCSVTRSQNFEEMQVQTHGIQIVLVPKSTTQPNILRQTSQPSIITANDITHVINQSGESLTTWPSLPKPRVLGKRGRPRKGQERKPPGMQLSSATTDTTLTPTTKLPILPVTSVIVDRIPDE